MMIYRLSFLVAATGLLGWAQAPDYFPLQVSNQWIYRSSTGAIRQIEVTAQQAVNDGMYYAVSNFAGSSTLLRRIGDQLVKYDSDSQQDVLVEDFGAAVGQSFATSLDSCTAQGTIADNSGGVLVVTYTPSCADAGIVEDRYVPGVGLVSRTEETIAGPRKFDLVYANIGGIVTVSSPRLSFGLSLDQGTYTAGSSFMAQMTLRNTTPDPIVLEWFSLQRYDVLIFDATGNEVYRWSNGRAFAQLASNEDFQGERSYVVIAPLALPPGRYVMQAYLTTRSPLAKKYSASVGFEIQ